MAKLQLLNALFWAIAMILAAYVWRDAPWADQLTMWLIVGYFFVNGLMTVTCPRKKSQSGG